MLLNKAAVLLSMLATVFSYNGQECSSRICSTTRGHISYISGQSSSKIWSIMTPKNEFTTIVLHLKDIAMSHVSSSTWLKIYIQQRETVKQIEVNTNEAKILSFQDANEAIIEVLTNDLVRFQINYYVGCYIHDGKSIFIERERSAFLRLFSQRRTARNCWFIFPLTRDERMISALKQYYANLGISSFRVNRDVSVKETYLSLADVSLTNGTAVTVYNMITGKAMMSADRSESYLLATATADQNSVNFSDEFTLKQAFFIDLQCRNKLGCGLAKFKIRSYGMQQSDLNCLEKEIKCKYNVGDKNYSCTPRYKDLQTAYEQLTSSELTKTSCPAFNYFSEHVMEEYAGEITTVGRVNKTNKKRKICKNFKGYCRKGCKAFAKNNCARACLFVKKILRICQPSRGFGYL